MPSPATKFRFNGQFYRCKKDKTAIQIEEGRTYHCCKYDAQCVISTCKLIRPFSEAFKEAWDKKYNK